MGWTIETIVSIIPEAGTDDDGRVGGNNNDDDIDGIAMVDVARDRGGGNGSGWMEGRESLDGATRG